MNSPLVTQEYFFPVVQVVAEPKFPDDANVNEIAYNIETQFGESKDKGRYQLSVDIQSIPAPEGNKCPNAYKIHLIVIGFFEVSPKWPNPEKLIRINGASILYSAAREFLLTITSRGPWGALMLPTFSFNGSSEKDHSMTEKSEIKQ